MSEKQTMPEEIMKIVAVIFMAKAKYEKHSQFDVVFGLQLALTIIGKQYGYNFQQLEEMWV